MTETSLYNSESSASCDFLGQLLHWQGSLWGAFGRGGGVGGERRPAVARRPLLTWRNLDQDRCSPASSGALSPLLPGAK